MNDALATTMETSKKQTIVDGEESANKGFKEILAFEVKKHEDNMVLHC